MCGICGVVQVRGRPRPVIDPAVLDWMTDVMTHRGPDDRGTYLSDGVALGVRRLSIVDVEGGHQPIANEDGQIWAIQNGELYNHLEVRKDLAAHGHILRTACDTEVLPHLYEQYGSEFPTHLRGMFGVAVWDEARQSAVIARDRLGVKPIYYALVDDLLVFASELKGLLASGLIEPRLDLDAIDAYLTFGFFPAPMTPLLGVSKLQAAHRLVVDQRGLSVERYWEYPKPQPVARRKEELIEELLERLDVSVQMRLMSDVPLGAMLSGGIDSSMIVALMAKHMRDPVKTFSVGFAEAGEANELGVARSVAEFFGTDHHELELSLAEDAVELEDLVWYLDEPLADLSAVGFIALSELASRHVTVALSGQGADELLGGYQKYRAAALLSRWHKLPRSARVVGEWAGSFGPPRLRRAVRTLRAPGPTERLLAMSGKLDVGTRSRLLRGALSGRDGQAARDAVAARLNGVVDDPLSTTLYVDGQLALVDDMLHYFDRASMAHSLEVRVPFLDHPFVEFCATIPPTYKVRGLTTKYVLKEAARGLIPEFVIDRPKIGFFHSAVERWFRAQAGRAVPEYLLCPNPAYEGVLDQDEVRRLVHSTGGVDPANWQLLLSILMLEIWLSKYLPRALASSPRGEPLVHA
jgi:asparagine synthase (glutamine-hydrolysing)